MNLLLLLQSVLITGGTVHPMEPGAEARVADVLIVDGRIEAIGSGLEAPEDALALDASGRHLVPGLLDGMIHHDLEHDPLYVRAGITLARDLGNDLGRIFLTNRSAVRDNAPGPSLFICGTVFDGVPPATTESIIATTALDIEHKLPRLLVHDPLAAEEGRASIDFVAFHLGLPEVAWRRLIELAHELDLTVWGPLPRGVGLAQALAAGQDGLLYLESLLPIDAEGRSIAWDQIDAERLAPNIEALRAAGTALTPLLRAYALRIEDPGPDPPVLARLSPQYESLWRQELELRRQRFADEEYRPAGRDVLERQKALLLALHEAGVPLVPGSGSPNPWLVPGESLHEELDLWVEAGIPPLEVLRHATLGAARALGLEGERGALRPGLVADILVLDGDPRTALGPLRRPSHVLLRGRVFARAELDLLLERLIEAQAEIRERDSLPIPIPAPDLPQGSLMLSGYVESSAFGQRFSGERYAVVREDDGTIAYVGRLVTPGGVGAPPTVLHVLQRVADVEAASGVVRATLVSFELEIQAGGNRIGVQGQRIAGQFNVRRTLNDVQVDNNTTTRRPMLVDAGSVTAALILAQHARPGPFDIVYFEDLEPALGQWAMEVRPEGILAVATPLGPLVATFKAHGGLDKLERVLGSGRTRMQGLEARTYGGPGLQLPKERVAGAAPVPAPEPEGERRSPQEDGGGDDGGQEQGEDDEGNQG